MGTSPLSQFVGENALGTWTLFVSDLGGGDTGTLNGWSLQITHPARPPGTIWEFSGDVPQAIPDDNPVGITSVLQVPSFTIDDVNLLLFDLEHTCVADLHIELTSPQGTTVPLILAFTEGGIFGGLGCPDNFLGTILDDEAVGNLRFADAPYWGRYNIDHTSVAPSPFQQFISEDAGGTWTLAVSDRGGGDVGTLNAWGLEFDPVETPTFLAGFDLEAGSGFVEIGWSIRGEASAADFRLHARRGEEDWEVPAINGGTSRFRATDESVNLALGGRVTYSLSFRETGEGWMVLGQKTVDLPGLPVVTRLLAPRPNPFNPRTVIPFFLGRGQQVDLSIHDGTGRRIIRLVEGFQPRGGAEVVWDGVDARGRPVPSGVYFVHLATEESRQSRKVMLLK